MKGLGSWLQAGVCYGLCLLEVAGSDGSGFGMQKWRRDVASGLE